MKFKTLLLTAWTFSLVGFAAFPAPPTSDAGWYAIVALLGTPIVSEGTDCVQAFLKKQRGGSDT